MRKLRSIGIAACLAAVGGLSLRAADVTGSGTTDYIPLWTSSSAIGNSLLYQKSGFVGVNNTSPAYPLDVTGYINSSTGYSIGTYYALTLPGGVSNGNTAVGAFTLANVTTATDNTASGYYALNKVTTANYNTAVGTSALENTTTGGYNTAVGFSALIANTTGLQNTAIGEDALVSNTNGDSNVAVGQTAMYSNTSGLSNTGLGVDALGSNTTASYSTAVGVNALFHSTTGGFNTALGADALPYTTTGTYNIGIGWSAGANLTTGSNNIVIANQGAAADTGVIRIGTAGTQTSFFGAGIYGTTLTSPVEVVINSNGQLGTISSSIRYKEDVHDMADASSKLLQLRPVTYRYKQPTADGSKPVDYGLIAEEVAQVYPDLVVKGADGQIDTVQYQKLTPMLLNEVQKQAETIRLLEKRLEALEAK